MVADSPALSSGCCSRLVHSDRQLWLVLSPAVWLCALARAVDVVLGCLLATDQLCVWTLCPISPAQVAAPLAQAIAADRVNAGLGAKRLCGVELD